jgi:O-antigen/teichoic acid export membrane protein
MTARGRIARGVGAGLLGQGLNIIGRVLLIPLFLSAWGAGLYGEWLILSSAVAFLSMTDFGGQVYFVNRMTSEMAQGRRDAFDRTFATAWWLFITLPLLFALAMLATASAVPLDRWLGLSRLGQGEVLIILVPLTIQMVVSLPQGLLLGVYRAIGMQATSVMLGNFILLLQLLFAAGILFAGGGPALMAWSQLVPVLLVCVWAVMRLGRQLPGFQLPGPSAMSVSVAQSSFKPSFRFMAIQMTQLILQQGTVVLVGRLLGATEVVVFTTVRTVVNSLRQLLGLIAHSAWPEFTRQEASRDGLGLQSLFYATLHLTMFVAFLAIGCLDLGGEVMMRLWLGDRLPYPASVVHHFSVYILLALFATLTSNVLMATNRHHALASWQLLISGVALLAFSFGIMQNGVAGGVLGLVVAEAVPACLIYAWLLGKEDIGIQPKRLAIECGFIVALAALAWWKPFIAASFGSLYLAGRLLRKRLG